MDKGIYKNMMIPRINCEYYDEFGFCKIKPKKRFLIFFKHRVECCETGLRTMVCKIAKRFPRPKFSPAPGSPK